MKAICFGEVLYDRFPDGDKLGGAAMNCAWYMKQLGAQVTMVSAIGNDQLGKTLLITLKNAGIDCTYVSIRPESTGIVEIVLNDGQPHYTIRKDVAWDFIDPPQKKIPGDLLYFGTLAQRTSKNRDSLSTLLSDSYTHRFFDDNLRQKDYSPEIIHEGLLNASVVKMNEEERDKVYSMLTCYKPLNLIKQFNLQALIITLADRGAELFTKHEHVTARANPVTVVDAVGAGDAFSAVICISLMNTTPLSVALKKACEVGSYVAKQRGAQVILPKEWTLHSA